MLTCGSWALSLSRLFESCLELSGYPGTALEEFSRALTFPLSWVNLVGRVISYLAPSRSLL